MIHDLQSEHTEQHSFVHNGLRQLKSGVQVRLWVFLYSLSGNQNGLQFYMWSFTEEVICPLVLSWVHHESFLPNIYMISALCPAMILCHSMKVSHVYISTSSPFASVFIQFTVKKLSCFLKVFFLMIIDSKVRGNEQREMRDDMQKDHRPDLKRHHGMSCEILCELQQHMWYVVFPKEQQQHKL